MRSLEDAFHLLNPSPQLFFYQHMCHCYICAWLQPLWPEVTLTVSQDLEQQA